MTYKSELKGTERLQILREPFDEKHISKLPKPSKKQTDEVKADYRKGIRCTLCGAWHHKDVVHLDYVGHAALTDRLLETDLEWNWEPIAVTETGAPVVDNDGGMWIFLTVCGVTRRGYGDAKVSNLKTGSNATKERIGDALRNAAMRFGAALDLWSKADLSGGYDQEEETKEEKQAEKISFEKFKQGIDYFKKPEYTSENLDDWFEGYSESVKALSKDERADISIYLGDAFKWLDANGKNKAKEPKSKLEVKI